MLFLPETAASNSRSLILLLTYIYDKRKSNKISKYDKRLKEKTKAVVIFFYNAFTTTAHTHTYSRDSRPHMNMKLTAQKHQSAQRALKSVGGLITAVMLLSCVCESLKTKTHTHTS